MNELVTNIDVLREIALDQHGYVTRAQALEAGVNASSIDQLVHRKRIDRAGHGIYRIPQVPATQYDNLQLALLWTGRQDAVLSHETALAAYDVCDIISDTIHVTVPKNARIRRSGAAFYHMHHEELNVRYIAQWEGMNIVSLTRAIEQCLFAGTPTYLLRQAIATGSERGQILPDDRMRLLMLLESRDGNE